jgi:hypothetical protein
VVRLQTITRRTAAVAAFMVGDEEPMAAGTSSGSCCRGPARTTRPQSQSACVSSWHPARSWCAVSPKSANGSRSRLGSPGGMPAKAVPNGMPVPMRRCTRRSDGAATASASLACSSFSFDFGSRCKIKIRPHISFQSHVIWPIAQNNTGTSAKSATMHICAERDIAASRHMPTSGEI